jgi:hypothetical protein
MLLERCFATALLCAFILATTSTVARAETIVGGTLYVTTSGNVKATYRGNSASYDNRLFLDSPTNSLGEIFFNHGDAVGTSKDLGHFNAGDELVFRMHVDNTNNNFFTGSPARNVDKYAHARITYDYSPTETLVEFEDLLNGPFNYNDLSFSFTNLQQYLPPTINNDTFSSVVGDNLTRTITGTDPNGFSLTYAFTGFVNATGVLNLPVFDAATHSFHWNTTGTTPGVYVANFSATSTDGLVGSGMVTITLASPEPGSLPLLLTIMCAISCLRPKLRCR